MASQQIPILSPSKGVVRAVPREGQPQDTCWDAMNMLPWDRYGRKRLAQRPGIQKQFTQQMSNNFVQGMIEAPNIIYPPAVFEVAIDTINNLGNIFPQTTPGTIGPITQPASGLGFTIQYRWTFNIAYTGTVTWDGVTDPWGSSTESATSYLFFPLGTGSPSSGVNALSLILAIGCASELNNSGFPNPGSSVAAVLYEGVPSAGSGSWTTLGFAPQINNHVSSGAFSVSQSVPCVLTIDNIGNVILTLGSDSPLHVATGPWLSTPVINLLSSEIDAYAGGSGTTNYVQSFTVTD